MSETENGTAPMPEAEAIIAQLRELVVTRQTALAEHDRLRSQIVNELRTYEKALQALQGEPRKAGRPKGQSRTAPSKLSDERLAEIERIVREFAADHEEFRQVDIRSAYGTLPSGGTMTSGMSAIAFEALRQRNVIRVARQDGNSKFYRLTREALNAS
jgi:hypothetical protein